MPANSLKYLSYWLIRDALIYKQNASLGHKCVSLYCLDLALFNRDYRLNILARITTSRIKYLSAISETLLFYLYGSTISPLATLHTPIRFCHARSVVIGANVKFHSGHFAYLFNNVTLGKASPLCKDRYMPEFCGNCFFGVGSVVLGQTVCRGDVVFGANSFTSNLAIEPSTTIISTGSTKPGVFYAGVRFPFLPVIPPRIFQRLSAIIKA